MPFFRNANGVLVEARQLGVSDKEDQNVLRWAGARHAGDDHGHHSRGVIAMRGGDQVVRHGDWIIKDMHGQFYRCIADVFAATYKPLTE